eukprot:766143-Hanusia_phi.AAC.2
MEVSLHPICARFTRYQDYGPQMAKKLYEEWVSFLHAIAPVHLIVPLAIVVLIPCCDCLCQGNSSDYPRQASSGKTDVPQRVGRKVKRSQGGRLGVTQREGWRRRKTTSSSKSSSPTLGQCVKTSGKKGKGGDEFAR